MGRPLYIAHSKRRRSYFAPGAGQSSISKILGLVLMFAAHCSLHKKSPPSLPSCEGWPWHHHPHLGQPSTPFCTPLHSHLTLAPLPPLMPALAHCPHFHFLPASPASFASLTVTLSPRPHIHFHASTLLHSRSHSIQPHFRSPHLPLSLSHHYTGTIKPMLARSFNAHFPFSPFPTPCCMDDQAQESAAASALSLSLSPHTLTRPQHPHSYPIETTKLGRAQRRQHRRPRQQPQDAREAEHLWEKRGRGHYVPSIH